MEKYTAFELSHFVLLFLENRVVDKTQRLGIVKFDTPSSDSYRNEFRKMSTCKTENKM